MGKLKEKMLNNEPEQSQEVIGMEVFDADFWYDKYKKDLRHLQAEAAHEAAYDSEKAEKEEIEWKLELADAILEEAIFNDVPIKIGDKIEHQLGSVYVGENVVITTQITEG